MHVYIYMYVHLYMSTRTTRVSARKALSLPQSGCMLRWPSHVSILIPNNFTYPYASLVVPSYALQRANNRSSIFFFIHHNFVCADI